MAAGRDFFYCPPSDVTGGSLVIGGEEFSHLAHVMRKREGDELMVVDGKGTAFEVVVSRVERRSAVCTIVRRHERYGEPGVRVTLGVGLLKNPSRFDVIVEKATELGVREVVPLRTARTIPGRSKSDRWRKLALAAMKQCGRSFLPGVRDVTSLEELVGEPFGLKLVAHEIPDEAGKDQSAAGGAMPRPDRMTPPPESVLLLIGPEGGFSGEEIGLCRGAGCTTVYLGPRRLRTETAAIASLALLGL